MHKNNHQDMARFDFGGQYHIKMPMWSFTLFLFLLVVLIVKARDALKWLQRLPYRTKEWLDKRAREKIVDTLIEGLTAVAAGQGQTAEKLADRVLRVSPHNPIGLMIGAQGAFLNGNHKKARLLFDHMAGLPDTAFLGLRGLIVQARHDGDIQKTYSLLSQALRIRPDSPWVLEQMVHLSVRLGAYDESLSIIKKITRISNKQDIQSVTRQEGLIYWLKAEKELKNKNMDAFVHLATRAHAMVPDNPHIAIELANQLAQSHKTDKALKILKATYATEPNLNVGHLYIDLKKDQDPLNAYRTVEKLVGADTNHVISKFLIAQSALKAKLWGQARQVLGELEKKIGHTQRLCSLMAQLEESEHPLNKQLTQDWLKKASHAPKDDSWMCSQCHYMADMWQPFCDSCSAFDSMQWTQLNHNNIGKNPLVFGKPDSTVNNLISLQG